MNKRFFYFCVLGSISVSSAFAQHADINHYALMTARDMTENKLSNISLINRTGEQVSASGLFIASFDVNDCSACFGGVVSGDNAGGTSISPVTIKSNQSIPIGQNFLYNMIYNGIYYIKNTAGSSPCSLPGCTWPGDDSNVHGWCLTINALSVGASYNHSTYTNGSNPAAKAPPYSQAGNSPPFNYQYDLINPNTLGTGSACLGPITCDDTTLTCSVSTAQSESIQAY